MYNTLKQALDIHSNVAYTTLQMYKLVLLKGIRTMTEQDFLREKTTNVYEYEGTVIDSQTG